MSERREAGIPPSSEQETQAKATGGKPQPESTNGWGPCGPARRAESGQAVNEPTTNQVIVPNHHAHYGDFSGIMGIVAAASMTVGRDADARLAIRLAELERGAVVVDVGCGPGAAARHAARAGATVIGVDPASVMRRFARVLTRRSDDIGYVDGSAENLPVANATANVVWSIATVHHWRDVDAGLREAGRILVAGGRFVAIERRVRPGATGHGAHGDHGWTDAQAEVFAARAGAVGFENVRFERNRDGRRETLAVVGTAP
jgi:SAM-dependent methyltransferase